MTDGRVGKIKYKDLTGKRFGTLTATHVCEVKGGCAYWRCVCDCGNAVTVRGTSLTNGNTKSCGCLNGSKEHVAKTQKGVRKYRVGNTNVSLLSDKPPKNNTSGRRGVSFNTRLKKWEAYVRINNKKIHLGFYYDFDEAAAARENGESEYFGPYLVEKGKSEI